MYGPWEIVDWDIGGSFTNRRYMHVRFKRLKDGNTQVVNFYEHPDGRWRINRGPFSKLVHPRELKVEIRNAYKILDLLYSVEKDNEQNK